jgi:hypothetical protein
MATKKTKATAKKKTAAPKSKWGYAACSMAARRRIASHPFLMFNANPEEAAKFYA